MTKETPIVLTTEKVTYPEMNDREKQIYDNAYQRGIDDMRDVKVDTKIWNGFSAGFVAGFIIALFLYILSTAP